jgi:hypothetical protein
MNTFEEDFPSLKGKLLSPDPILEYGDPIIRWKVVPIPGMKTKGAFDKEAKILTQKDIDEGQYYFDCIRTIDLCFGQWVFLKKDIKEYCMDKYIVLEKIDYIIELLEQDFPNVALSELRDWRRGLIE